MSKASPRFIAATILARLFSQSASLKPIPILLKDKTLPPDDIRFISCLCFGTIRFYHRLDCIAQQLMKKPLALSDQIVYALLLSALYQIDMLNTPAYAALNETVNAAKRLNKPWAPGFLNACLRRYLRDKTSIHDNLKDNLVAHYAHPQWLIDRFKHDWPNDWIALLEKNNEHPPMCIRVNIDQISRDAYLHKLSEQKHTAYPGQFTPESILLEQPISSKELPAPQQAVAIQDQAAQLAAHILDAQPGHSVLDACSAPGGKAQHILQRTPGITQLVAVEKQMKRFQHLKTILAPYKHQVTLVHGDACKPNQWWDQLCFDRILIDAPCSGTGVIRRHPDIKLLRQPDDIGKQIKKQWHLLRSIWPLLKPGGILVYSTCSVLTDENASLVKRFIKETPDCQENIICEHWGNTCAVGRQILPTDELDGFYYARLEKIET